MGWRLFAVGIGIVSAFSVHSAALDMPPYMWCRGQAQSREDRELFRIKGEFLIGNAGAAFFLLLAHSPWGGNGLVTGLEAILLVCSLGAAFVYGIYFIKKKISESISRIIR